MENRNETPLDFSEEMKYYEKRRKRRRIGWGIASPFLAAILIIFIAICTAASPRVEEIKEYAGDNKYITFTDKCLVSAHRAGGALAPENTLKAFENCLSAKFEVDILEFDLHRTKDGEIILLHDDTLNRTSNAGEAFGDKKAYASEYTLAEIKSLNMGENFVAEDGSTPYKGLRGDDIPDDLRAVTLKEVLQYTESKRTDGSLKYIIEIKDDKATGERATDSLYSTLTDLSLLDRAIVGTFHGRITKYMDDTYPDFIRSSSIAEVLDFWMCYLFDIDLSKKNLGYEVMQIPYKLAFVNLGHKSIIDYAHKYGLAMQYWTINNPSDIQLLIERGADCIISDYPDVVGDVFEKIEKTLRHKT